MSNNMPVIAGFTPEDLSTMQATIAKGTTPAQFNLFVRTAAASGLNPFLNHIYCIVYGQTMNIQISVEGIVYLAKKVEGYQGIDVQLVHDNDEFEASIDPDGKWNITVHKFKFPRGKVIAGYAIAYREGFKPFVVFMERDEVEHNLKGNNKTLWEKYFNDFFKKHMVKRAAKGQFGIDISEDEGGMTAEPSVDNIAPYQPQRQDVTPPQAQETPAQPRKRTEQRNVQEADATPVSEPQAVDPTKEKAAKNMLVKNFELLGIEKKDRAAYIQSKLNLASDAAPGYEQIVELNKMMEDEIAGGYMPEELE